MIYQTLVSQVLFFDNKFVI